VRGGEAMEKGRETVVVAGATGRTGKLIVEELVNRGYHVRAMVRSVAQACALQREGVEILEGDLTSVESLEKIMEGAQYLISAIGSRKPFNKQENNRVDNMGNQNLAKAALKKGIRHIVVISSIGVGDSRYAIGFFFRLLMTPVLRMKEKSEEFIRTCGINYTIIRPGGLADKELPGKTVFGEGGKISGSVSRKEIARTCVDALTNPAMKKRTLEVVNASTVKEELKQYIVELK
jgi:uncharacterized protein YbjT (DUF2867 family)